jgi:NAD(P)-dependent dehydrogenase (short-subunit alcohol dehydrogenase family)
MSARRVVMVSGAGSGLGRALAAKFVEAGCVVVGLGRTESTLAETKALIQSRLFEYHVVDVADYAAVKRTADEVFATHGRIDYLFNSAAVYPRINFLDETANQWAAAIDVNVNGPANCCKAVLPWMIRNGFGRIYNVGSFADRGPIRDSAAYSCSKGALHALGLAIQADIAGRGVDVEVHEWVPGHLRTQMSGFTGIDPDVSAAWAVAIAGLPPFGGSRLFVNDRLWLPPRGLRGRVKDLLTLRFLRGRGA